MKTLSGRAGRLAKPTVAIAAVIALAATAIVPVEAHHHQADTSVQMVVKIQWGQDPATVVADLGGELVDVLVNGRRIVLIETDDKDAKAAVKRLTADARIVWAEENAVGSTPEGDRFHAWPSETWPREANSLVRNSQPAIAALDLDAAHELSTGTGVKIAVLDTGIDASHPALKGKVKRRLDVIDGDFDPDDVGNGIDDDGDGHIDEAVGHGTHVAGAILLAAPDATILGYRVLNSDGQGTVFGVAEAVRHAVDAGAHVINLSFGTDKKIDSQVLKDAIAYAKDNGVLVVAAAGNSSSDKKRYPAADAGIVSVGAYDPTKNELAKFASHGKWVTVAAPGVNITSTVPGGGYATWSGSSMAAPFVSAQAALLLAVDPELTLDELIKLIKDNTAKIKGKKLDKGAVDYMRSIEKADK